MKKNVIVRSNREYDYFGNVLEYEYDYLPSYSSTSTSTQKVLVLEYEYKYTSTITPSLDLSRTTRREHYQMPMIEEIATRLSGARVFTVVDSKNGFWQVGLNDE